ncbi:MAG: type II toxin-antitoxin system VapB family antitoxin [Chitinophagales bacterium]|nr:type II toxin-antitoxin system VapB family antitoxin [Chitinophagales bacterium]
MRTNVELDDALIEEVKTRANVKTKREAIHIALSEYLKMIKRKEILNLRGKVKWEGNLDEMRKMRS